MIVRHDHSQMSGECGCKLFSIECAPRDNICLCLMHTPSFFVSYGVSGRRLKVVKRQFCVDSRGKSSSEVVIDSVILLGLESPTCLVNYEHP